MPISTFQQGLEQRTADAVPRRAADEVALPELAAGDAHRKHQGEREGEPEERLPLASSRQRLRACTLLASLAANRPTRRRSRGSDSSSSLQNVGARGNSTQGRQRLVQLLRLAAVDLVDQLLRLDPESRARLTAASIAERLWARRWRSR
ncbi:MAG: hypothetical protein PW947_13975 [Paraburkholderia sp.]|nr:hypothetical protein [Paraburkholderia sp.]MDE1181555.1 hypothetical protein [Paraburkholderia sp.]